MRYELRELDTVTIIGLGKSCYDWVRATYNDFRDTEGEVWTINAGAAIFRHDVVWDMHTDEWLAQRKDKLPHVIRRREWMRRHDKPIVMPKVVEGVPMSRAYPLKDIYDKTGSLYLSGGLAYPLAYFHACGGKTLRLFGCDFSYDRDTNTHDEQGRACCEYLIGRLVE